MRPSPLLYHDTSCYMMSITPLSEIVNTLI